MKDEWESLAASGKLEAYFVQLLDTLNRMATIMERFDNVMNPTLGLAEEEFRHQAATPDAGWVPVRLRQVD